MTRRDDHRKAQDARRRELRPSRRWYTTQRWRRRRARQLKIEPLCRMCAAQGKSRPANTADHIVPHRDDPELFWQGELQSLCETCHNSPKQRAEREGFVRDIGEDGWPVDPNHIFNRSRR